jgi:ABC-type uncharacterized transport system permease subunit
MIVQMELMNYIICLMFKYLYYSNEKRQIEQKPSQTDYQQALFSLARSFLSINKTWLIHRAGNQFLYLDQYI